MSVVDAVATSKARAVQCGLSEEVINGLASRGWDTYAGYAFSSSYVPGHSDDSAFKADVVMPLLGSATHVDVPKLRRLLFESYTLAVVEVQGRTSEPTDGDVHRKLPVEEKSARLDRLAKRLPGLRLDCKMEPSHHLID
eukprot:6461316-Amphidinium_carterae.1